MTERLYYSHSKLAHFHSRVADIRLLSRCDEKTLWQVTLERSAFYPTSGGQPHDLGVLRASSRSGAVLEVPVLSVDEDEHGEVWHTVEKPLSTGTDVEGLIDFPRRLDHMQQHTGQHLLSAVLAKEMNAATVSFHLGEESSTIDLKFGSLASKVPESAAAFVSRLPQVERLANELIAQNRSVSIKTVGRDEAEVLLARGELRKLPDRDGPIRLIEIEEYDLNACGGTHLEATGEMGILLLRSAEKLRGGLRIEFVCGLRALAVARRDHELLTRTAAVLCVNIARVPEAVERLLVENKATAKDFERLKEQMADMQAGQLLLQHASRDNPLVIRKFFDRTVGDKEAAPDRFSLVAVEAEYCKLLASRIVSRASNILALVACLDPTWVVITIAASKGQAFSCGELLKIEFAKLRLRGGGSQEMAQGKIPSDLAPDVAAMLDSLEAAARRTVSVAIETVEHQEQPAGSLRPNTG